MGAIPPHRRGPDRDIRYRHRLEDPDPNLRDWDYLTDFLHHKLLLADNRHLILGGRNVEDSYHMRTNPLLTRYRFLDTDLEVVLRRPMPELGGTFDRLWQFRTMVATLDDVLAHAPNDFLAATLKTDELCGQVEETKDSAEAEECRTQAFAQYSDAEQRIAEADASMRERADRFRQDYRPAPSEATARRTTARPNPAKPSTQSGWRACATPAPRPSRSAHNV